MASADVNKNKGVAEKATLKSIDKKAECADRIPLFWCGIIKNQVNPFNSPNHSRRK